MEEIQTSIYFNIKESSSDYEFNLVHSSSNLIKYSLKIYQISELFGDSISIYLYRTIDIFESGSLETWTKVTWFGENKKNSILAKSFRNDVYCGEEIKDVLFLKQLLDHVIKLDYFKNIK